jgi:hypothetical protein
MKRGQESGSNQEENKWEVGNFLKNQDPLEAKIGTKTTEIEDSKKTTSEEN